MSATTTEETSVTELLELSRFYHNALREIADAWEVEPTAPQRTRAFQILSDLSEDIKMTALATAVLAEVKKES